MEMRKFVGEDMKDALGKVKEALGPDAVVFATRKIRPRGLFGPQRLEISAALNPSAIAVDDAPALPEGLGSDAGTQKPERPLEKEPSSPARDLRMNGLRNELRGLREELRGSDIDEGREALSGQLDELRKLLSAYSLRTIAASNDWFVNVLENADVELEFADEIGGMARQKFAAKAGDIESVSSAGYAMQTESLIEAVKDRLERRSYRPSRKRNVIAVVGPTGVGKTTTIAKLAANASLRRKQTVGLITTDVFRVGAIEQIQQYAALIGIPMEAVSDADGFRMAMSRFEKYDLVLIDTAGRNPRDLSQINSMVEMFESYEISVHLAVESGTRQYELREIVERYQPLQPDAVIMTKYDEARKYGALINANGLTRAPISYITMGQRVPEDIVRPDFDVVARETVESVLDGAGSQWRQEVLAEAESQARQGLATIHQWSNPQPEA